MIYKMSAPDTYTVRFELQYPYGGFADIMTDRQVKIADQVVAGDKVVTRWQATGVHAGEFNGIPATGRRVSLTGISIDRIAGGRIVESWEVTDDAGLLRQLGVMPSP